ncbi:Cleavage and polyadenylation specificity factor subunit 2 [Nymphaea thermarum]|nr:Cleavage and polyadenylation specificity factor subunit 2 [Nymphaea thermarum]
MGTSVQVTPLCGVHSEYPLSYLLSIDGFNFLVDCVSSKIDAVLLSHPDTLHLGALPYAMKHLGLTAPVYATEPVYRLGLLTMYDHYLSRKGEGIVIAPHVAGHLLGGTVWKITKDGEDVVYAVDYNHRKERHLNATVLGTFVRPAVLITDAYNALNNQPYRRQRDQELLDSILKALRAGGNVLLPIDTAGRVLELVLILEQHWAQDRLNYPIIFLTNVAASTIDYVKSFLEWMSDSIAKSFEQSRDNAFVLKHVNVLLNKNELEKLPEGPKVVLASMASLEEGFSHDIFVEWASESKNLVIFTERGQFGTLARMLQVDPPPKAVKVTVSKRVPLVGEELRAYEEEQSRIKKEEVLKASLKEEDLKSSNEVVQSDPMVIDSTKGSTLSEAISHNASGLRDILIDGFVPPSSSVAPMFPFFENSTEWDDFGEVINPDDYMIKEEDVDQNLFAGVGVGNKIDEISAELLLDTKPSKVVSNEITVQVKCSLIYMDFEGRSDGHSMKSIIKNVAPLKLVLVHGSAEATEHLKQHCLKNVCSHVYAPQIDETIDVTSDLSAYKIQLSERVMSNVLFKKLGEYEIAWIDGEVGKVDDMLSLLPLSSAAPPHKSVLVGDLKLADFKHFLSSKGVSVELSGGVLRCGEYVTVRKVRDSTQKSGTQHVVIEGPLCEEFYKIREYLYSQFYLLQSHIFIEDSHGGV